MAHYDFTMPVTEAQVRALRVGDTVTLNGTLYGIRDATQIHMFDRGRKTRFDLRGHALIHTAPNVRWIGETKAAPTGYAPVCFGTTTSARMERFTRPLMREYGARILIGKGGLGADSAASFQEFGGAYLAVVGGAAAVLHAMEGWEDARVQLYSRTRHRAEELVQRFRIPSEVVMRAEEAVAGATLVVNASPVGLRDDTVPVGVHALPRDAAVIDLAYRVGETTFVRDARARGLRAIDGLTMLIEQGALAFERWFGITPDRELMWKAVTSRS